MRWPLSWMRARTCFTGCPSAWASEVSSSSLNRARPGFRMAISKRAKPQGHSYSSASSVVAVRQQGTSTAREANPSPSCASMKSPHHLVSISAPQCGQPIRSRFCPPRRRGRAVLSLICSGRSLPLGWLPRVQPAQRSEGRAHPVRGGTPRARCAQGCSSFSVVVHHLRTPNYSLRRPSRTRSISAVSTCSFALPSGARISLGTR